MAENTNSAIIDIDQAHSWDDLIRIFPEAKEVKTLIIKKLKAGYTQADICRVLKEIEP